MSIPTPDDIRRSRTANAGSVLAAADRERYADREVPAEAAERLRVLLERPGPPVSQPGAA